MKIIKTATGSNLKISREEWEVMGKKAGWMKKASEPLGVGSKVRIAPDALGRHSKTVPPHAGYTPEQFSWRRTLDDLGDQVGEITRVFPNSNHVNVTFDFDNLTIGIESNLLVSAE